MTSNDPLKLELDRALDGLHLDERYSSAFHNHCREFQQAATTQDSQMLGQLYQQIGKEVDAGIPHALSQRALAAVKALQAVGTSEAQSAIKLSQQEHAIDPTYIGIAKGMTGCGIKTR